MDNDKDEYDEVEWVNVVDLYSAIETLIYYQLLVAHALMLMETINAMKWNDLNVVAFDEDIHDKLNDYDDDDLLLDHQILFLY